MRFFFSMMIISATAFANCPEFPENASYQCVSANGNMSFNINLITEGDSPVFVVSTIVGNSRDVNDFAINKPMGAWTWNGLVYVRKSYCEQTGPSEKSVSANTVITLAQTGAFQSHNYMSFRQDQGSVSVVEKSFDVSGNVTSVERFNCDRSVNGGLLTP